MKSLSKVIGIALFLSLVGCNTSADLNNSSSENKVGSAQISIQTSKVGALHKSSAVADINLVRLVLDLSADGQTSISDTTLVSGNAASQVVKQIDSLASLVTWTVVATTYDVNDSIIHQGSTTFEVYPATTEPVSISMDAKYSMLKAEFTPVRDSVTSLHLLVDGSEVNSTTFASGAHSTGSVFLDYDYLLADAPANHVITLQAKGSYWNIPYTLYEGQITIQVSAGQDTSYVVTLAWVGPGEPPLGAAAMTVNLGKIGTVNLNGNLDVDPFAPTAINGFTGPFQELNWTTTGVISYSFSPTTLSFDAASGGGGITSSVTIPNDGTISFDWDMVVRSAGQYGDLIKYAVNGNVYVLSSSGSANGSVTGVAVSQGDVFQFQTWGTTQSSSYYGSFTNFVFTQN